MENAKLFVGQIPRTMSEADLHSIFDPLGEVVEIAIIRHKVTKEPRGCAFVTYKTAESAIRATKELHHAITLPGARAPLHVSPASSTSTPSSQQPPATMAMPTVMSTMAAGMTTNATTMASSEQQQQQQQQQQQTDGEQRGSNRGPRKLFVAPLPKFFATESLREMFSPFGALTEVVIPPAADCGGRGYGFVWFADSADADSAVAALHGTRPRGIDSDLTVKYSDARQPSQSPYQQRAMIAASAQSQQQLVAAGFSVDASGQTVAIYVPASALSTSVGRSTSEGPPGANVFVRNLPPDFSEGDLTMAFAQFGAIVSVKVCIDRVTGRSKCFGFVSFMNPQDASRAIAVMDGVMVRDRQLHVSLKGAYQPPPHRTTMRTNPY